MLLAILSIDGCNGVDEHSMDGTLCWNNICRKSMVQRDYVSKTAGIILIVLGLTTILGIISINDYNSSNLMSENHIPDNKLTISVPNFGNNDITKNMEMDMDMK